MEHSVKHLRAVLSVARTILMNLADAEEVAQEAVLKALSNIQGFRGQTRFSTWLIQIDHPQRSPEQTSTERSAVGRAANG